jgi:hypothetical protein
MGRIGLRRCRVFETEVSGPFARSGDAARLIELELEKRQRHPVRMLRHGDGMFALSV